MRVFPCVGIEAFTTALSKSQSYLRVPVLARFAVDFRTGADLVRVTFGFARLPEAGLRAAVFLAAGG